MNSANKIILSDNVNYIIFHTVPNHVNDGIIGIKCYTSLCITFNSDYAI